MVVDTLCDCMKKKKNSTDRQLFVFPQIAQRFHQLMKLFKKQGKTDA